MGKAKPSPTIKKRLESTRRRSGARTEQNTRAEPSRPLWVSDDPAKLVCGLCGKSLVKRVAGKLTVVAHRLKREDDGATVRICYQDCQGGATDAPTTATPATAPEAEIEIAPEPSSDPAEAPHGALPETFIVTLTHGPNIWTGAVKRRRKP